LAGARAPHRPADPPDALRTRDRQPDRQPAHLPSSGVVVWVPDGGVYPDHLFHPAVAEIEAQPDHPTRISNADAGVADGEVQALGIRAGSGGDGEYEIRGRDGCGNGEATDERHGVSLWPGKPGVGD